jgi:uncharacterized alkaline shock family protein YloU
MKQDSRTDLGLIRIHKKVIASIASIAASEIEGVKRIGGDIRTNLYELLGRKNYGGIRVEIDKNQEIIIEIPLVIKYGFNIPIIASKVQENIKKSLSEMTDLYLKEVHVNIQSIERL